MGFKGVDWVKLPLGRTQWLAVQTILIRFVLSAEKGFTEKTYGI
jgi:hypothetical protein